MSKIELRDYQAGGIERLRFLVNQHHKKRLLLVGPCGMGKGHIIASLLASCVAKGNRALAIAHRVELIEDLADRVCRHGFMPGVVMAGHPPHPERPVQVASIQTLARREKPVADLVIIDEAHHSTASSYLKVLEHYPEAVVIGLTATPCRLGGQPLGDVFTNMVEPIRSAELVDRGLLVPVKGFAYDDPKLNLLKRSGGDFVNNELAAMVDVAKVRGNVVQQYLLRAPGSRALVFAVNVEHAKKLAEEFKGRGVAAEQLDCDTPREERAAMFARFKSGATRVLCQCQLFTEGIDVPAIETVILARPTASLSLALQMIGRGRRILQCECGLWPHWRQDSCACGRPVKKRFVRIHDHGSVIRTHGMPDDPREWSLTETFAMDTRTAAKPGTAIRSCRQCFAIYMADEPACPQCGAVNRAPKRIIRTAQGVAVALEAVEREQAKQEPTKATAEQQFEYFRYLVHLEHSKGYRRGYAEMRFHGRFRCWPPAKLWRARLKAPKAAPPAPQAEFVPAEEA
jgi:superfamily II DNA or RNA helicase